MKRSLIVSDKTEDIELRLLLEAIFRKYHYDFRGYSMASLKRRLTQAKEHFGCRTFSQLQDRVLHDPAVLPELLSYLTVQVSELFRDPGLFPGDPGAGRAAPEDLPVAQGVGGGMRRGRGGLFAGDPVPRGRARGPDTSSTAPTSIPRRCRRPRPAMYELDRIPLFTENHRKSGGKSSLSDYYTAAYGAAVLDKSLRQRVVFSDHSLVTDAVFAEVQLVSCRNVLIYFDRELQDRAIGLFKDSLTRKGFLGLGAKENLRFSRHADAFTEFARDERIYQETRCLMSGVSCRGRRHRGIRRGRGRPVRDSSRPCRTIILCRSWWWSTCRPTRGASWPTSSGPSAGWRCARPRTRRPIRSGNDVLCPPDYHLLVEPDRRLSLSSEEPVHFCRPSIDVLFETAAEAYEAGLVGIILTGANADGARGLRAVQKAGGTALVQRPDLAHASMMPQAALDACPGARVMSLEEIAAYLQEVINDA